MIFGFSNTHLKMSYYVLLALPCLHNKTDENKLIKILCEFKSEQLFDMHDDIGFHSLIEPINQVLPENYYVDDAIEVSEIYYDVKPDNLGVDLVIS